VPLLATLRLARSGIGLAAGVPVWRRRFWRHSGEWGSSINQRARSRISLCTAEATVLVKGHVLVYGVDAQHAGCAFGCGVDLPDQSVAGEHREREVPHRRLAAGLYISS